MKTSVASLLIGIAGFLQESKCVMFLGEATGTVGVTMDNHESTGTFIKVLNDIPRFLVNEPSQPFKRYRVHFHGCDLGRHETILRGAPRTSGHQLNNVHVRIGTTELRSYDHPWQRYVYGNLWNLFLDCMRFSARDYVYITVPETTEVFYVPVETPAAHQARQQSAERLRLLS